MSIGLTFKRKVAERVLQTAKPYALRKLSEKRAIAAFHKLAERSPRYREILAMDRVAPETVGTIEAFRAQVPILTKERFFGGNRPAEWITLGGSNRPAAINASSGSGSHLGYSLVSRRQARKTTSMVDLGLALHFRIDRLKTLIINCLPMGIFVPSDTATVLNLSVREDNAIAAAAEFAESFDQLIFLSDPFFAKKLADAAIFAPVDWARYRINVLIGGECSGENFRRYLEHAFQIDPQDPASGSVRSSMGLGEIGLNLLFETPKSIALAQAANHGR